MFSHILVDEGAHGLWRGVRLGVMLEGELL